MKDHDPHLVQKRGVNYDREERICTITLQGGSSMKVYRTDEIRNVVLLGHGGSGKTSLVEAMLYVSGATNRMGKVSESNTVSDFDKEEQKRGF